MIFQSFSITRKTVVAHKNRTNYSPYTARRTSPSTKVGRGHTFSTENFSQEEAKARLSSVMESHGVSLNPELLQQFTQFYFLLMEGQKSLNMTRLVKLRDIAIKHFVDCCLVPQMHQLQFPLLDLGSGPGFPGIPLKLLYPNQPIFLAEGVQKRVDFLKSVRESMNLNSLGIFGRNINPYFFYPVRTVITRAVEDMGNTLSNVTHSLQVGGDVIFMKGPGCDPEIESALKSFNHQYKLLLNKEYVIPFTTNQRRLVIFRRLKAAPLIDLDHQLFLEESEKGDFKQ